MIVTVTPNPAVDITYTVDQLTPGGAHRVTSVSQRAGGKGVNVARVLRALGERALVVAPLGGSTGEELAAGLDRADVPARVVRVGAASRRTITVVSPAGEATAFNEPGVALQPDELSALLAAVAASLAGARVLVLSGSLPPDAPPSLLAHMVAEAQARGVPCVVDAVGPALLAAAAAEPDVVKPNAEELLATTGEEDPVAGARDLLARGARCVVVSQGAAGMLGVTAAGTWHVGAVPGLVGNPTGAGDAAVAGLASALATGLAWPESLRRAGALGAAAVLAPAAGDIDLPAYERFLTSGTVERVA